MLALGAWLLLLGLYTLFLRPWGHDIHHHLFRLWDSSGLFDREIFSADLSPHAAQGKGLPMYVYYSQWVYLVPYLLQRLGLPAFLSLKLAFSLMLVLAGAACYRLARLHAPTPIAAMAAFLFIGSSYVLGDVFVRSAYSEFLAYALLPLALYSGHKALSSEGIGHLVTGILALSAMILFHPISFMNAFPLVAVYVIVAVPDGGGVVRRWPTTLALLGLPFALTAFFWVPATVERAFVLGTRGFRLTYAESFVEIGHYLDPVGLPLHIGPLLFVLTVAFAMGWLLTGRRASPGPGIGPRGLLVGVGVYFFLMSPVSHAVWELVPPLQANVFAWRLMFPLALLAALFVAVSLPQTVSPAWQRRVVVGISVLAIVQALSFVGVKSLRHVSIRPVSDSEIAALVRSVAQRTQGWGVSEYLPDPDATGMTVVPEACVLELDPGSLRRNFQSWQVDLDPLAPDCFVHLPVFWNTRYRAYADGREIPVFNNQSGEILLRPGQAARVVSVVWSEPAYVRVGKGLSLFASGFVLLAFVRILIRRPRATSSIG